MILSSILQRAATFTSKNIKVQTKTKDQHILVTRETMKILCNKYKKLEKIESTQPSNEIYISNLSNYKLSHRYFSFYSLYQIQLQIHDKLQWNKISKTPRKSTRTGNNNMSHILMERSPKLGKKSAFPYIFGHVTKKKLFAKKQPTSKKTTKNL